MHKGKGKATKPAQKPPSTPKRPSTTEVSEQLPAAVEAMDEPQNLTSKVSQASVGKGSHSSPRKGKGKATKPAHKGRRKPPAPKKRHSRMCPIGGCRSELVAIVKLSQHIKDIHPEIGETERLNLVRACQIVPAGTTRVRPVKKQKTMLAFFKPAGERADGSNSSSEEACNILDILLLYTDSHL